MRLKSLSLFLLILGSVSAQPITVNVAGSLYMPDGQPVPASATKPATVSVRLSAPIQVPKSDGSGTLIWIGQFHNEFTVTDSTSVSFALVPNSCVDCTVNPTSTYYDVRISHKGDSTHPGGSFNQRWSVPCTGSPNCVAVEVGAVPINDVDDPTIDALAATGDTATGLITFDAGTVLSPQEEPTDPVTGQFYVSTDLPANYYLYDGTSWVEQGPGSGLSTAEILAGTGISVGIESDSVRVTNTGVVSLEGRNGITVQGADASAQTGSVAVSPTYGTSANTIAQGNDARIPTQTENDALVGTSGAPSSSNLYVTDADARNTNSRTPTAHTSTHQQDGADEMTVASLSGVLDDTQAVTLRGGYGGTAHRSRDIHVIAGANITINAENSGDTELITITGSAGGGTVTGATLPLVLDTTNTSLTMETETGLVVAASGRQAIDSSKLTPSYSNLTGTPSTFTPETHAPRHANGGNDELDVGALSGVLDDTQAITTRAGYVGTALRMRDQHLIAGANITISQEQAGDSVLTTITASGSTGVASVTAGKGSINSGTAADPIVDIVALLPLLANTDNISETYDPDTGIVVGADGGWAIDSSRLTPTYANLVGVPTLLTAFTAGNGIVDSGTSTVPSVDVVALLPLLANSDNVSWTHETATGLVVNDAGRAAIDSTKVTPSWANITGVPSIVNTATAGAGLANSGTAADPAFDVNVNLPLVISSDTLSPTYQADTGMVVNSEGRFAIDSSKITITASAIVGGGVVNSVTMAAGVSNGGTSTDPSVVVGAVLPLFADTDAVSITHLPDTGLVVSSGGALAIDSTRLTPSYANLTGIPTLLASITAGDGLNDTGTSTAPIINALVNLPLQIASDRISPSYDPDTGIVVGADGGWAIDSARLTPSYSNLVGTPTLVTAVTGGAGNVNSGTSTVPVIDVGAVSPLLANTDDISLRIQTAAGLCVNQNGELDLDSTRTTITFTNITGVPSYLTAFTAGAGGVNSGTSTAPILDVGATAPLLANTDDISLRIRTDTGIVVNDMLELALDTQRVTIPYGNLTSVPTLLTAFTAGNGLVDSGTSTVPSVDVVALAPLVANSNDVSLRHLPDTGLVVNSNGELAIDSARLTPSYGNLTGTPSTFAPSAHAPTHTNGTDDIAASQGVRVNNSRLEAKVGTGIYIGAANDLLTDSTAVTIASLGGDLAGASSNATVTKIQAFPLTYPEANGLVEDYVWGWDVATQAFTLQAQSGGAGGSFSGDVDSATNKQFSNSGSQNGGTVGVIDDDGLKVIGPTDALDRFLLLDSNTVTTGCELIAMLRPLGVTGNASASGALYGTDLYGYGDTDTRWNFDNSDGIDGYCGATKYLDLGPNTGDVLTITAGTLTSTKIGLKVTGTFPNAAATQELLNVTATGGGSSAGLQRAALLDLEAGYTGTSRTVAAFTRNVCAGTGTSWFDGASANYGLYNVTSVVSGGQNIGTYGYAAQSTSLNVGVHGSVYVSTNGKNVAGVFIARNDGAGTATGLYVSLDDADPISTFGDDVLLLSNDDVAADIIDARDGTTNVFRIADGGVTTISPAGNQTVKTDTLGTTITGAFSAPLVGDIAGTTDNNTVSKLQSYNVSTTAPADGQALVWESDYSEYYPQTPGAAAASSPTPGSYSNLKVEYTSANTFTITADNIVLSDASSSKAFESVSEVVDLSAGTGAGGPDESSLDTNNAQRSAWLIGKTDGTIDGLVSDDTTVPDLPSGYTLRMRVGWVLNDGSANLVKFVQLGPDLRFRWDAEAHSLLAGGTSTSFATVAAATHAPPTARWLNALLHVYGGGGANYCTTYLSLPGDTSDSIWQSNITVTAGGGGVNAPPTMILLDTSQQFSYKVAGTSAALYVYTFGYRDTLGGDGLGP